MREVKIFKEPNSYEKMTKWSEKNKDKFEMDIIFVENGYGIEYKPFKQVMVEPKYKRVDTKSVKDNVEFLDRKGDFYIYKSYVPYDYKQSTIVYFVSDDKGNEYGQYPTLEQAKKVFQEVSK